VEDEKSLNLIPMPKERTLKIIVMWFSKESLREEKLCPSKLCRYFQEEGAYNVHLEYHRQSKLQHNYMFMFESNEDDD
jgi:hypothetical protein